MKPFGRIKKLQASGSWKKDYHIHHKGRKMGNWWENICEGVSRSTVNRMWRKDVDNDINTTPKCMECECDMTDSPYTLICGECRRQD